jgi:hypothetical protein
MTTRLTVLLLLGTMLSASAPAQKKMTIYDSLREQLYVINNNDEIYRNQMDNTIRQYGGDSKEMKALLKKMSKADSINLLQVAAIIEKYGWLGPDQVGSEGNSTLFMLGPLADYLKENFKLVWDVEKYKKANPDPPPNSSPRH